MLERVDWFNHWRLLTLIGNVPPTEGEQQYLLDAGGSSYGGWNQGTSSLINSGRFTKVHGFFSVRLDQMHDLVLQFQSVGTASGHFFQDGMELEIQAKQIEQAIKALGCFPRPINASLARGTRFFSVHRRSVLRPLELEA